MSSWRQMLLRFLLLHGLCLSAHAWLSWTRLLQLGRLTNVSTPTIPISTDLDNGIVLRSSTLDQIVETPMAVETAEKAYGMPWRSSIDPSYQQEFLFYMPFWEWQLSFMKENLNNLRVLPTMDRSMTKDMTYAENTKRKKRMITLCFASDEYRLIRMTFLDAGPATQVFTSLWCPRANLPVLGIDLLQFNNQKRHLTVVDFQPIHPSEEDHDMKYEHLLEPIRRAYPSLQNKMSDRFYDENQFFSSQMLLGKGDQTDYVWSELMPAYKAYVQTHLSLVKNLKPKLPFQKVLQYQKAYDDYSSVRDPAHGLLAAIFGKEYADDFVFDVLFPLTDGAQTSR